MDIENTVTDMQIDHHFFYNTLNEMASMALEGGSLDLYQSIIYLSRMIHYSSYDQGNLVSLKNELNYVESYLQLQKIRYKNSLEFYFDIDDKAQNAIVPFNFLQPLTENAFVYGCEEQRKKYMEIQVRDKKENVEIRIINRGKPLPKTECLRLNGGMKGNKGHSLGRVYQKLETFYGDNFSMKIYTKEDKTIFYVKIPK
ncbi:MAG: histidine kinase [Eubacteriales bacterium]|nr:histidine kinase [Eubacteriales bacterium]